METTEVIEIAQGSWWARDILISLLLIAGVLLIRRVVVRRVRKSEIKSAELRRRWIITVRNACFFLLIFGLVIIWSSQLRTLALSVLAILVALVLATKELILCLTGSILKVSAGSFSIGDKIEVDGIRGQVIDQTLLATKIIELGPGQLTHQATGKAITLPNSIFLTAPVINETFTDDYALLTFTVPVKVQDNWQEAEKSLLNIANDVCQPFLGNAKKRLRHLAAREGLDAPSIEPRVALSFSDPDQVNLIVRIPAPVQQKNRLQQDILRRYLTERGTGRGNSQKGVSV